MRSGTWASPSRVAPTISGSASSAIIAPAVRNDCPVTAPPAVFWERKPRKLWLNTSSPKIASTTLGVPAMISTADSTARASRTRPPVLAQPRRQRHADRTRRSRCRPP